MSTDQPSSPSAHGTADIVADNLSPSELRMQYTEAEILDLLTLREQIGQREGASSALDQNEISSLFRK